MVRFIECMNEVKRQKKAEAEFLKTGSGLCNAFWNFLVDTDAKR